VYMSKIYLAFPPKKNTVKKFKIRRFLPRYSVCHCSQVSKEKGKSVKENIIRLKKFHKLFFLRLEISQT